jgi:tRNA-binding protein
MSNVLAEISWGDFEKVALVAGTVTRVEPFPEARKPAWKVWVDFGSYGERKTSAQIAALYSAEQLIGRQVIGVINFPDKQIGPFRSQFLLTGYRPEPAAIQRSSQTSRPCAFNSMSMPSSSTSVAWPPSHPCAVARLA